MDTKLLFAVFLIFNSSISFAQNYFTQYFDGADTSTSNSIIIELDTTSSVWRIGSPQKTIFNSAATLPNALITDSINSYPINTTSRFRFKYAPDWFGWGILALQWKQKLDLDKKKDGAIIEYSVDSGTTWQNVFNDPYVYNFYGFDISNQDTLISGEYAFSGTDTNWRDIWLCFDNSYLSLYDTVLFRYTLISDSIDNNKEGWIIDNMLLHITGIHTVNEEKQTDYLKVYPTITDGIVNIEAVKLLDFHIIESMELINMEGRIVERFGRSPVKFFINIRSHVNGLYYLKVNTNIKTKTFPVVLQKSQVR